MNQQQVVELLSPKLKLVRVERGYTQDYMADVLGISKKTLVQIEKDRQLAGWTCIVALCALFRESEVIHATLGGDPMELLETIVHLEVERSKEKTLGGKVWWREVSREQAFRVQQNVISQHYRILDNEDYRWYTTFSKSDAQEKLVQLAEKL